MKITIFAVMVLSAALSPHLTTAETSGCKNAVFNDDFRYGLATWRIIGGKDKSAALGIAVITIADVRKDILTLSKNGTAKWWVTSDCPIKVVSGTTYKVTATIAGHGSACVGVFEYKPGFLRNKVSAPAVLTPDFKPYVYEYLASQDATEIRPAMLFESQDGRLEVNVERVVFEIPEKEFDAATAWPKSIDYVKSKDQHLQEQITKFKDYAGISERRRQEIRKNVEPVGILAPYEKINKLKDGKYALTMSDIDFGDTVFPQSIKICGKEVLAAPISAAFDIAGKTRPDGKSVTRYAFSPEKAVIAQDFEYGACRISVECELNYDALIMYKIHMSANAEIAVSHAELNLSMRRAVATYFSFCAIRGQDDEKGGETLKGFGPIPAPGETFQGKYNILNGKWKNEWKPITSADANATLWRNSDFLPTFWIGDEDVGIGYIRESEEGNHNEPGADVFTLTRTETAAIGQMRFISSTVKLSTDRQITFGLQATPPKKPYPNWHKLSFDESNLDRILKEPASANAPETKNHDSPPSRIVSLWHTRWSEGCGTPRVADPVALRDIIRKAHASDCEPLLYLSPTHLSLLTPEGVRYGLISKEWSVMPEDYYFVKNEDIVRMCPASFLSEYQADEIGKLIDNYGVRGIYFDNAIPRMCDNKAHGCGFIDDFGNKRSSLPVLALRKFLMMVRNQFQKRGVKPVIAIHGYSLPGAISFVDYVVAGEGVYALDYTDALSPAETRAYFTGHQHGCRYILLPQFSYLKEKDAVKYNPKTTRSLLSITLSHGVRTWAIFCNAVPIHTTTTALESLDGHVEFLPYWKWR